MPLTSFVGRERLGEIKRLLRSRLLTLTGTGGVIGVPFGVAISVVINQFLPSLPSVVPPWAIITGVLVSMSVGLFFGMYPAMKAAKLDPIDALRYE